MGAKLDHTKAKGPRTDYYPGIKDARFYRTREYHSQFRFFFDRFFRSALSCDSCSGGDDDNIGFSTDVSSRISTPPSASPLAWLPPVLAAGLSDGGSILSSSPSDQLHASLNSPRARDTTKKDRMQAGLTNHEYPTEHIRY